MESQAVEVGPYPEWSKQVHLQSHSEHSISDKEFYCYKMVNPLLLYFYNKEYFLALPLKKTLKKKLKKCYHLSI